MNPEVSPLDHHARLAAQLESRCATLTQELAASRDECRRLSENVAWLESKLQEANEDMRLYDQTLDERDALVECVDAVKDSLGIHSEWTNLYTYASFIDEVEGVLQRKDAANESLRSQVRAERDAVDTLVESCSQAGREIESLRAEIANEREIASKALLCYREAQGLRAALSHIANCGMSRRQCIDKAREALATCKPALQVEKNAIPPIDQHPAYDPPAAPAAEELTEPRPRCWCGELPAGHSGDHFNEHTRRVVAAKPPAPSPAAEEPECDCCGETGVPLRGVPPLCAPCIDAAVEVEHSDHAFGDVSEGIAAHDAALDHRCDEPPPGYRLCSRRTIYGEMRWWTERIDGDSDGEHTTREGTIAAAVRHAAMWAPAAEEPAPARCLEHNAASCPVCTYDCESPTRDESKPPPGCSHRIGAATEEWLAGRTPVARKGWHGGAIISAAPAPDVRPMEPGDDALLDLLCDAQDYIEGNNRNLERSLKSFDPDPYIATLGPAPAPDVRAAIAAALRAEIGGPCSDTSGLKRWWADRIEQWPLPPGPDVARAIEALRSTLTAGADEGGFVRRAVRQALAALEIKP